MSQPGVDAQNGPRIFTYKQVEAAVRLERERTIAAVIGALREGDRSRGLHGWPAAADFIENHPRFGSSVSGGE
jgi:hypothetical protein